MHGKFSALNQQTTYRADIDGLRAVAVLGVLFYHASVSAIPGGFVGVDVFFVISGYLITGIIKDDCLKGTFSFLGFYGRRARRILPALIVVLACSLAAGWFILLPPDYEALSKQAVASALFVPNFLFWSEAGYFDHNAISKPLLHLWSLGIEEQFYLLWPMILVGAARKRTLSISFLILITLCSFALCVYLTPRNSASAFYLPQSRAWELSLGALIAYVQPANARQSIRSTLSVLGLLVIAATMLLLNSNKQFPGYIAALPALGTGAVIWAGRDTIAAKALSWKPITYVGLISFPLYLCRLNRSPQHRRAGSTGRRNTGVKSLCWGFKLQGLTRSFVELTSHFVQMGLRMHRQVGALRKVLSQQAIGILVRPALPRALRIAKVDVDFGRQRKATMIRQFLAPVPGQGFI